MRGGWCFATAPPLTKKLGEWALSATEGGVGILGSSLLVAAATHMSENLGFVVLIGVSRRLFLTSVLFVKLNANQLFFHVGVGDTVDVLGGLLQLGRLTATTTTRRRFGLAGFARVACSM